MAAALDADVGRLRARAQSLAAALPADADAVALDCVAAARDCARARSRPTSASNAAATGGGGPVRVASSAAVSLPERYAAALRAGRPPVVGRLEGGRPARSAAA
ncbi:hypothetical protein MAHJHV54_47550 [Mycobacterium avium subsp. hominissuis]